MMLDMRRTFDEMVVQYSGSGRAQSILDNQFYQTVATSLAGTQEYMAMEKLGQLLSEDRWDLVVVDTPPSRNALDFLDAPERLSSFLDGRFMKLLLAPAKGPAKLMTAGFGLVTRAITTIIVAALSIVLGVTAAALGAYAFSQLTFRGKSLLFLAYIGLLMIPWTLTLIPLFLTIQKLHLFNTWWALVLPYAASAQPLLVLIFRGFFEQIPRELMESARVDGCSERQVLARIVLPLTRPVLLTGAILVMINVWGDYLWPTIVIQDPAKITISAGVQQFVGNLGQTASNSGAVFAAFVIATVPMFALVGCAMRYFVSGLTEGALKL